LRYGDLNQVVPNQFFQPFLLPGHIQDFLDIYDPKNDYLLLSGDPVIIGMVIHAAFSRGNVIQILKYEKRVRAYADLELKDPLKDDF